MRRKNTFLLLFCILVLLISPAACGENSFSAPKTYFIGKVIDSNGNGVENQVVVLYADGLEVKRVVPTQGPNFFLELDDSWGVYDCYRTEYSSKNKRSLDIGNLQVGENLYFFVQDKKDSEQSHAIVIGVIGDVSTVPPARLKLGADEFRARQVLYDQVKNWTQVVSIPSGDANVNFYLTYLSPQLLESAIEYQSILKNLSAEDVSALESEVKDRLREKDTIAFLLRMMSSSPNLTIKFGDNFSANTWLENIDGDKFSPSEYDHMLDYPLLTREIIQSYIYFPKSYEGKVSVDLDRSPSIFIASSEINISNGSETIPNNIAMWRFNLVPIEFPLADLEARPPSAPSSSASSSSGPSSNLGISDLLSIINFIFDFMASLVP